MLYSDFQYESNAASYFRINVKKEFEKWFMHNTIHSRAVVNGRHRFQMGLENSGGGQSKNIRRVNMLRWFSVCSGNEKVKPAFKFFHGTLNQDYNAQTSRHVDQTRWYNASIIVFAFRQLKQDIQLSKSNGRTRFASGIKNRIWD